MRQGENMPEIRPSSDLRNKYNEISEYCHMHDEPVFITKNGTGDLVVLSNAAYDALISRITLHQKLNEGLDDMDAGRFRPFSEFCAELEKTYGLKKV